MFSVRGGERQLCLCKGELKVSYFQTGTRTWSQDGQVSQNGSSVTAVAKSRE